MTSGLRYEVAESRDMPGEWRAEAINYDGDGEVYVVLFSGPSAKERAEEYADWKSSDRACEVISRG